MWDLVGVYDDLSAFLVCFVLASALASALAGSCWLLLWDRNEVRGGKVCIAALAVLLSCSWVLLHRGDFGKEAE